MDLPDDISRIIHQYLLPISEINKFKYKYSMIWCKKCGELFQDGDWCWLMSQNTTSTMLYTCKKCSHDNFFTNNHDFDTLLDYISYEPNNKYYSLM